MSDARGRSRHTTTIVLVVLAGIAAAWLFLAERGRVTTEEREARHGRLFPAWRGDDVARIAIVSSRGSFTVARNNVADRDDRGFTLEAVPGAERVPADPQAVDRVLSSLDLATVKREVPKGAVDRSAMGLDAPRVRVEVTMGDLVARVAIGNAAASSGEGAYAEVDGERVVVVASALVEAVDVGPETLRDKKIVPYTSPDIVKLLLDGEGGVRRFERAEWPASRGTAFRLEGGPRVDARTFRRVVEALGGLEAEVLVDGEPAPADAKVVVTLTPKSGPEGVVALGAPCPGHDDLVLAARRAPSKLAGCVKPEALLPFVQARAGFEDRHAFAASRDELVEVKVDVGGKVVLEMARRGTGFFVRKPAEQNVPDDAARGFVDALTTAAGELEKVTDADLASAETATLRVISRPVAEGDPERIEIVTIGPSKDGKRPVRRGEDGAGLWIDDASLRPLLASALVLRDRRIVDVAAEQVREVTVTQGKDVQRVRRAANAVELVEPRGPGLVADEQWGLELLDRTAQLTALRWVSATDDGAFALSPPRGTIEIRIEDRLGKPDSERTVKVLLGARGDDGTFAQLAGKPEVFLLPPDVDAAATRPLVDRGALSVRIAAVKKLSLRAGSGAPFDLEKRDGALVPVTATSDPTASSRAAKVRDGLEDLVALSAVTVGDTKKEEGLDVPVLTIDVTPDEGRPYRLVIGASDVRDGASIHYARRSDVGATYAVAPSGVRTLLEALR